MWQQRQVMVGFVLPGMLGLVQLQRVGQAVHLLHLVEAICTISDVGALDKVYMLHVWAPVLQNRPRYAVCVSVRDKLFEGWSLYGPPPFRAGCVPPWLGSVAT